MLLQLKKISEQGHFGHKKKRGRSSKLQRPARFWSGGDEMLERARLWMKKKKQGQRWNLCSCF